MDQKALAFQSYLLRIWPVDNDGWPVCRYSLRPIRGGPDKVFSDPNELLAFLEHNHDGRHDDNPSPIVNDR